MKGIQVKASIKSATTNITAKAILSTTEMQMIVDGTQLEDFSKSMAHEEIRTEENVAYFKGLVLEVLQEQGLIRK